MYFYPTLTEELKDSSGYASNPYSYSYMIDTAERKLIAKGKSTIKLEDSLESWKIESDGLRIRRTVSFEYPEVLFGKDGIACSGSELGICIIWINRSLTQMGTILPINEYMNEASQVFEFDYEFMPGELQGDLELDMQMYIKKSADDVSDNEAHLINDEGVTVGILEETHLDFGSIYMEFPIQEISNKQQPLWWLEIGEWSDPTTELFNDDNICIFLNTAYDSCPKMGDSIKYADVLIDIITTAYVMIFKRIEELGFLQQTINDVGLEQGSISKILFYFKDGCETDIDFSSVEHMHRSIWMNIASMIYGGEEQ